MNDSTFQSEALYPDVEVRGGLDTLSKGRSAGERDRWSRHTHHLAGYEEDGLDLVG